MSELDAVLDGLQQSGASLSFSTSDVRTFAVLPDGPTVLIGTTHGRLHVFAPVDANHPGAAVETYGRQLHAGPLRCVSVSSSQSLLVATGGQDSVCCVQPLSQCLSPCVHSKVQRLHSHTLPITCVRFLSTGDALLTAAADGRVVLHRAWRTEESGRSGVPHFMPTLAFRVGFPVMCITPSLDETIVFVGGEGIAVLDLMWRRRIEGAAAPSLASMGAFHREESHESTEEDERRGCQRLVWRVRNDGTESSATPTAVSGSTAASDTSLVTHVENMFAYKIGTRLSRGTASLPGAVMQELVVSFLKYGKDSEGEKEREEKEEEAANTGEQKRVHDAVATVKFRMGATGQQWYPGTMMEVETTVERIPSQLVGWSMKDVGFSSQENRVGANRKRDRSRDATNSSNRAALTYLSCDADPSDAAATATAESRNRSMEESAEKQESSTKRSHRNRLEEVTQQLKDAEAERDATQKECDALVQLIKQSMTPSK